MRNPMRVFLLLLIVVVCAGACEQGDYEKATEPNEFSLLTYNVAGLPQGISQSDPIVNSPQIAVKLNRFDVVLAQEDFFYHYFLRYGAAHPYQSRPDYSRGSLGDGLNRFSFCAFSDHERIGWDACYGYIDHA
ncbi:MAG: hypothetical protein GY868_08280, partial [Deltaproteobacteria bacterium]|nr:hypothetical protein [Deltaproteobacteria bacterium]